MFRFLWKEKVKDFVLYDSGIVILDDTDKVKVINKEGILLAGCQLENVVESLHRFNTEGLVIKSEDEKGVFIDNPFKHLNHKSIREGFICSYISCNRPIIISSEWLSYYPVEIQTKGIDVINEVVKWQTDKITNVKLLDDLLLSIDNDFIKVYNLLTGKLINKVAYRKSLTSFKHQDNRSFDIKVEDFLGIKDDDLWIRLNSGELKSFSLLSGLSSNIIDEKDIKVILSANEQNNFSSIPKANLVQMDSKNNEIIGLRNMYYIKLDLKKNNLVLEYKDISSSMISFDIKSSYREKVLPVGNGCIYFCDDEKGKIGVFDRAKEEVIWSYQLEIENGGIAKILKMEYSNDLWCILDRNKFLHTFRSSKL